MAAADGGGEAAVPARPRCEELFDRLVAAGDGGSLELLKLCGVGVPADVDVYLCKNTFTTVQVRAKVVDQPEGLVHEYGLDPASFQGGKPGVYELQCTRSKHHVQVKVQPALGLEDLLPPFDDPPAAASLGLVLEKDIWTLLGIYHLLWAFVDDPSRSRVPLAAGYEDGPRHLEWVLADSQAVDKLAAKCGGVFSKSYGQPAALNLADPSRPRTRGLLQKALLEVKMLLVRAIWQFQTYGDSVLSASQMGDFEAFMLHAYESCCKGGAEAQTWDPDRSAETLRRLICGGEARPAHAPPPEPTAAAGAAGGGGGGGGGAEQERLGRALEGVLQGLMAADRGLEVLAGLGENVAPERRTVTELHAALQARLGGGGASKRQKVS